MSPDAADSAEPPSPRQASGDGSSPHQSPPDELPPASADTASAPSSGPPSRSTRADGLHAPSTPTSGPTSRAARLDGLPATGDSAGGPPSRTTESQAPSRRADPADKAPLQSPPAAGPPPRSPLAEKARATRAGGRPRRTAADVARAAESARKAAGVEESAGDGSAPAGDRARRGRTTPRADKDRGKAGEATSDGPVERERPGGPWPMPERSLMATVLGVHPAAAVGVAAAFTAVGVAIDLLRVGTLGTAFTVCYLVGCVLATAWVRRSGLFWPMVAPPLLMALAVPVVVLVAGSPRPGAGIAQRLLVIGAPLVNGFPMMAWTTGLVLALGVFRLVTQRVNPGRGAARAGGRTSTSPRRS